MSEAMQTVGLGEAQAADLFPEVNEEINDLF
jgi:hypothetical protein